MCQGKFEKGERETECSERATGWLKRRAQNRRLAGRESVQAYSEGLLSPKSPWELAKVPSLESMPFWAFPFWALISHKRKSSCSLLWQEGLRAQGRSCVLRALESGLEKPREEEEGEGNTRGQTAFIRVLRRLGPCEGENLPRVGFKAWDGDRAPRTKKEMAQTSASLLSKLWETPQNSEEDLWKEARALGMKNWAGYHCTLWPQSSHVSDGVLIWLLSGSSGPG